VRGQHAVLWYRGAVQVSREGGGRKERQEGGGML
jgi:hypothetical protein